VQEYRRTRSKIIKTQEKKITKEGETRGKDDDEDALVRRGQGPDGAAGGIGEKNEREDRGTHLIGT